MTPTAGPAGPSASPFEAIVLIHHGEIHRYLCRLTARTSEAEDMAQETFLRAYRAWAGLPSDTNHRAWLYTIATNIYRNHVRSERRRRSAHATVRVTRRQIDVHGPEGAAVAGELRALTESAIRALPLKQRLAFCMRKLEELDYDSIGRSLDCSAETARAHVFQALRKIRTALDGHALPSTRRTS
jgi:RNA polymerase sigma factor (sigma-70 family)